MHKHVKRHGGNLVRETERRRTLVKLIKACKKLVPLQLGLLGRHSLARWWLDRRKLDAVRVSLDHIDASTHTHKHPPRTHRARVTQTLARERARERVDIAQPQAVQARQAEQRTSCSGSLTACFRSADMNTSMMVFRRRSSASCSVLHIAIHPCNHHHSHKDTRQQHAMPTLA